MKTTTKKIVASESGGRLDIFLTNELQISRSQAQKMINDGEVLINGEVPTKTGAKVSVGDKIELIKKQTKKTMLKKDDTEAPPTFAIKDIKILAETPDYLVIEKPSGMLTHSTDKGEANSLAEILQKKYPEIKKVGENPKRPGIVHRLDKEASGLLVVAKTQAMFEILKRQFKERTIEKEYLVLVHGSVSKDWDKINFRLSRSENADRMAATPALNKGLPTDIGKDALTEFDVIKRFVNFTFLKVKIHTGRMHQIRVHMLAYNHPVVGDPLYFQKKRKKNWDEKLGRLFLHCSELGFVDLEGNKQKFSSALPPALENFLSELK